MSKALVKYKANVWGISKDRAREILKARSKRKLDRPEAFTADNQKINGGNGNGNHRLQEISRGQVRANQTA